jgi:pyruvate dehydrogenase E2 component (dihydrolipoamide acetyltransferase)
VRAASAQPGGSRTSRKQSLRKTIAARMMASFQGTAPVTLTTRADASNLEVLRQKYKAESADRAPKLTDLLIKLTATALQRHAYMNARWEQDCAVEIPEIHIGLAVDTDAGLLVPVLRDVNRLDVQQLAKRSRELADRARQGQLSLQEMQGGTFTITNLGTFGIDAFTPIINTPEIAILGIGALRREAVVLENDHIALRDVLTLSLTFDHRAVDGAPAARFLQTLCKLIEDCTPITCPNRDHVP